MPVPPYLPQGQEDPSIIAPAPRERDYPLDDEYGRIPEQGPALTPVQPIQSQDVPVGMATVLPDLNVQAQPLQGVPGLAAGKGGLLQALLQLLFSKPNPLQALQGLIPYPKFGFDPQTFMLSSKEPSYAEGEKIPDAASTDPAIGDLWAKEQQAAGGVNTTIREQGLRDMMQKRLYGDKSKDI